MSSYMSTAILILVSIICSTRASFVTFFPPSASQCSNFTVNFTGNQISFPITFLLLPVNSSSPYVVQLPDTGSDSVSDPRTYTTPIPFAAGTQFIAVMHDTRGVGNGGVSTVYTVGASDKTDCLPQQGGDNTLAFRLSPSPPLQCEPQNITWTPLGPNGNEDISNNVNITGYVPGGLAFRLEVSRDGVSNSSSVLWQTSVPQGQDYMFLYERTDPATGTARRETSAIQNVQAGSNSTCTQGGASVTPAAVQNPTSTQTLDSAPTSSGLESIGDNSGKRPFNLPKSALIGITVGGACVIAVLIALLYLLCVRNRRERTLSPLEDDQQISNESRAALMKIDRSSPTGISLPLARFSVFGIESSSPYGRAVVLATTAPAQGERGPSPDAVRQRGVLGRIKGRPEDVSSIASWGNKGPLTQSMIESRLEPNSVPVDSLSDISEYSTPDSHPLPLPQAAIVMSRNGNGPGRQRMQLEWSYPQNYSRGSGTQQSSGESRDRGNPSIARDGPPAQTRDSRANEYSPTGPDHLSPILISPVAVAGRASTHPAPVQPPSRANPLVQRRVSAYEGDDDYYASGAGRTRTGAPIFRPAVGQHGIAL